MLAAFAGFLAADMVLVFAAGLPAVRRFFLRHGAAVTRVVGVLFIAFGAKSIFDAANGRCGGRVTAPPVNATIRAVSGAPP